MTTRGFSIGEAVEFGWNTFKARWLFFVGLFIVVGIASSIHQGLSAITGGERAGGLMQFVLGLVGLMISTIVSLGVIYILLKTVRGEMAEFGDFLAPVGLFLNYLVGSLVIGVIVTIGLVLLIVPGIFLAVRLGLFSFALVDHQAGPFAAIQQSWEITRGNWWNLFLLGVVCVFINLLGALALGVGLLVSMPVTALAATYAYSRLREPTAETRPAFA